MKVVSSNSSNDIARKRCEEEIHDAVRSFAAHMLRYCAHGGTGMLPTLFDRFVRLSAAISSPEVRSLIVFPLDVISKALSKWDWRDGHPNFVEYTKWKAEARFGSGDVELVGFRLEDIIIMHGLRVLAAHYEESAVSEATAERGFHQALESWFNAETKRRAAKNSPESAASVP